MRRSEYDHVASRINPPQGMVLLYSDPTNNFRPEYERSARILPAPTARQPLLGDAPQMNPYASSYGAPYTVNSYSNGIPEPRRRGFDKGPSGEDLRRVEGRQQLMRNMFQPRLAVEHVGGDMDISRSRSVSPEVISARSVRDDRKKDRTTRSRRSRSRSRDRYDRGDRGSERGSERGSDRGSDRIRSSRAPPRDRDERHSRYEAPAPVEDIRNGLLYTNENYYNFLMYYIDTLHDKIVTPDAHGARKTNMVITDATQQEKDRIMLPPDFDNSDRERMLHCDMTITGLPASIFYGSGYGPRAHYAKYSAAKDMIEKCHRIGVVSSELYAAIGDWEHIDQSFKTKYSGHITKAVNAVILLTKRIAMEDLPAGFMTVRHLPSELIDKFKTMLRMVMMDVYYQGTDESAVGVPKSLETSGGYDSHQSHKSQSRHREDLQRYQDHQTGPSAEDILRQKQKELEEKMEKELAKKRQELEQEIREKFLKEEREKLKAELEREKNLELMKIQQQQYQIEKERKEIEETQRKTAKVEEDFNAMVEQFGKRFEEVRTKGVQPVLNMIYASATYKTIQLYSTTLTSLSSEQKQQLAQDLRSLLDSISVAMSTVTMQNPPMLQQQPMMQGGMQPMMNPMMGYQQPPMGHPMMGYEVPQQPQMPQMMHLQQQMPQQPGLVSLPPGPSAAASRHEEVRRVPLGNMTLRALSSTEQRRLKKNDKVIAQDSKTGSWSLGTVVRIRENRATLAVGQATWKKNLDELYKEEEQRAGY